MHRDLEKLWALAGIRDGVEPPGGTSLDGLGLIPCIPLVRMKGYECTPLNSTTFARTGGDGVHFGFLHVGDQPIDDAPVVMSTPIADEPNVIVGETLREFLALGCRAGYRALEVLAFGGGVDQFLNLRHDAYEMSHQDARFLRVMTKELGLRPWPDVPARLEELQARYVPEVLWPPPLDFCKKHGMQDAKSVCLHFVAVAESSDPSGLHWSPDESWHLSAWCRDCDKFLDADGALRPRTGFTSLCEVCFAAIERRLRFQ